MAPAVLAETASGTDAARYVLCGERDAALLSALRHIATIDVQAQPDGGGPRRVLLQCEEPDRLSANLRDLASEQKLVRAPRCGRPAAHLAEILPAIDRWGASLLVVPGILPERFDVRRYTGAGFRQTEFTGESGLYELWPREPRSRTQTRPRAYYYEAAPNGEGRWLTGDWYGLRYLERIAACTPARASYDLLSARLAVEEEARPPEIYERALTLGSGRLPERRDGWLYYDDIDFSVLNALAARLHWTLLENDPHA